MPACGVIPTLRIGWRLIVPTARLRGLLGFAPDDAAIGAVARTSFLT